MIQNGCVLVYDISCIIRLPSSHMCECVCVCVCACVRACVRARVRACVCVCVSFLSSDPITRGNGQMQITIPYRCCAQQDNLTTAFLPVILPRSQLSTEAPHARTLTSTRAGLCCGIFCRRAYFVAGDSICRRSQQILSASVRGKTKTKKLVSTMTMMKMLIS